jgi:hypothetical protein
MRRLLFAPSILLATTGCATTSFAPPIVNLENELHFNRTQSFWNARCSAKPDPNDKTTLKRNTNGALLLISNYLLTYRCQRDRASEGRQFFEVPGFLAAAGGATAAALGAGPHVAIGTGATSAILGQGKSYYAPKDKAVVLNDGLDALLCIQNEAVGIDPYTLKTLSAAQDAGGAGKPDQPPPPVAGTETGVGNAEAPRPEPQISVSSERQYFEMIRTALFSVESVVANRLSAAGTPFDASGVIAEIEALSKKAKDEQAEVKADKPAEAGKDAKKAVTRPDTSDMASQPKAAQERTEKFVAAKGKLDDISDEQVGRTVIKLYTLQTKLNQCIVRAKI